MHITVDEPHTNAAQGIPAKDAMGHGGSAALLDASHVLAKQRPAARLVDELEVRFARLYGEREDRVLSGSSALLDVSVLHFGTPREGLSIRNAWLTEVDVDLVKGLQAARGDFEMKSPHAGERRLPRLSVVLKAERWVFEEQSRKRFGEALSVRRASCFDGHPHDRRRSVDSFENDGMLHITKGIACGEFGAEEGADFTGSEFIDVVLLVRKEANHATDAKCLPRAADGDTLSFDESA